MRGLLQVSLLAVVLSAVACGAGEQENSPEQTAEITGAVPTETPGTSTPTPIPGLTDTGYLAPDGSPLYAECIGLSPLTGAPFTLPPVYPTPPSETPVPLPSQPPPIEITPDPAQLPGFEFDGVTPVATDRWHVYQSDCYGLRMAAPDAWRPEGATLAPAWYQQGTGALFYADGLKLWLSYMYSPYSDPVQRARHATGESFGNGSYFLIGDRPVTIAGRAGVMNFSYETVEGQPYVHLAYRITVKEDWYLYVSASFLQPYDQRRFAEAKAFVQTIVFE